jgi:SAM-dependent methyltransferase
MSGSDLPPICDYEGSTYRTDFWEGRGRDYEDQVERGVLRRWLPSSGKRLLEIGAGFGRLTSEYSAFEQVVLLDYSFSQLQYAREHFGDEGYLFVAANAYKLPFKPGVFDAATMIRVIHHMADAELAVSQVRRVLTPDATFILEHANKRNLKAVLRYWLGRQRWSPFSQEPVEFVDLNFDFQPAHIRHALESNQLAVTARVPVSYLRLGIFKRILPISLLVVLDRALQATGLLYSPSVFIQSRARGMTANQLNSENIFACPESGHPLEREGDAMVCGGCGLRYAIRDGIYDFKAPIS